jgi:hypothetical protein
MKHGTFEIDELEFKGIYNPQQRWNGFYCPYFDLETAKKVLFTQAPKNDCIENDWYYYELSTCENYIVSNTLEGIEVYQSIIFEGVRYYPIGYNNWVWTLQDRLTDEA